MHSRGPELRKFVAPEIMFGDGALHLAGQYGRNLGGTKYSFACSPHVVPTTGGFSGSLADLCEGHPLALLAGERTLQ